MKNTVLIGCTLILMTCSAWADGEDLIGVFGKPTVGIKLWYFSFAMTAS